MPNEPTNQVIYAAVQNLTGTVKDLSGTVQDIAESVHALATHMDERFKKVESTMATKEQVERYREELVLISRKSNTKLSVLIEDLESRNLLDHASARKILALEPFPQM